MLLEPSDTVASQDTGAEYEHEQWAASGHDQRRYEQLATQQPRKQCCSEGSGK